MLFAAVALFRWSLAGARRCRQQLLKTSPIFSQLHRTGIHPLLDKLRREVPEGVPEMLSVRGLKPEKINAALGIPILSG